MYRSHIFRDLTGACLALGLLAFGSTAGARTFTIQSAARAAWQHSKSSELANRNFRLKGRNGRMGAHVLIDAGKTSIQVDSRTPSGRKRTTVFNVLDPTSANSRLARASSVLEKQSRRTRRQGQRSVEGAWGRNFHRFVPARSARMESARGPGAEPGTVGFINRMEARGYFHDSIAVQNYSRQPPGSEANRAFWTTPSRGW